MREGFPLGAAGALTAGRLAGRFWRMHISDRAERARVADDASALVHCVGFDPANDAGSPSSVGYHAGRDVHLVQRPSAVMDQGGCNGSFQVGSSVMNVFRQ